MLNLMRENAGSWIIKILLGIIVLVFIFLGIGPSGNKSANEAATVNDKVITMNQFRIAYNNIVDNYRRQYGQRFNDDMIKMLGIRQNTLESLIENELVNQEAARLGIQVAPEEIQTYIKDIPGFQTNGAFDFSIYQRLLSSNGQTPDFFENQVRKEIIGNRMRQLVTGASKVTDTEIRQQYLMDNTEIKIAYAVIETDQFDTLTVTDEAVRAYFDEHSASYTVDEQVAAKYLKFSPDTYKAQVKPDDAQIKNYYDMNADKFSEPEKVRARHILIKTQEDATPEEISAAKEKAMAVYEKATAGNDFAELAKELSEGPSGKNGGDLGFFERGQMVKPFSDKAFAMEPGDISEPVKTQFGWHVIKLEEKKPAGKKTLDEARPEIVDALKKREAENMAFNNSDIAFEDIINGAELDQAAKNAGVTLFETKFFTQSAGPSEVPARHRQTFAEEAFKLAEKGLSDVLDFDGDYYIIQVDKIKKPHVPELTAIKDKVTRDALAAAKAEKALQEAKTVLAQLKSGKGFQEGQATQTPFFKRSDNGSDMKISRNIIAEAFKLSQKQPVPEEPIKGQNGYYVIRLAEKKAADLAALDKERDTIRDNLVSQKQSEDYNQWLNQLKNTSEIKRNPTIL